MLFQLLTADGENTGVNSDSLAQLENTGASDILASLTKKQQSHLLIFTIKLNIELNVVMLFMF